MTGLEEKVNFLEKRRCAMVTSGGGLKAFFFHVGAGMKLQEEGFKFYGGVLDEPKLEIREPGEPGSKSIDLYVGSSGGALFSLGVAVGHSPKEMYELFLDDRKLKKAGLERGMHHYLSFNRQAVTEAMKSVRRALSTGWDLEALSIMSPVHLGKLEERLKVFSKKEDFRKVASDLFVVTTPLNMADRMVYCRKPYQETGRIIYRNDADVSAAVAGSCSLQCFHPFCVKHHNGDKIDVVDGETRKTLSYKIASDHGADLVFVSYTHVPYSFDPQIGSVKKYGLLRVAIQSVYLMIEEKILTSRQINQASNKTYDLVVEEFERLMREIPEHQEKLKCSRDSLILRIVEELNIKRKADYLFITPGKDDHEFYFSWHMGMSKKYIEKMVGKGYEAAGRALKEIC